MSDELKLCPFCGGKAEIREGSSTKPYIRCKRCGCRTGSSRYRGNLAKAWNARAERTCEMLEMRTGEPADYADTEEVIWHCQYCHAEMAVYGFDEDGDVWPVKPKYCQNCGAKVTR